MDASQAVAEAPLDLRRKSVVVESKHRRREIAPLGPDDGGTVQPLVIRHGQHGEGTRGQEMLMGHALMGQFVVHAADDARDRKSTRLNSSHSSISYAVFCLKKKKKRTDLRAFYREKKQKPRSH